MHTIASEKINIFKQTFNVPCRSARQGWCIILQPVVQDVSFLLGTGLVCCFGFLSSQFVHRTLPVVIVGLWWFSVVQSFSDVIRESLSQTEVKNSAPSYFG